MKKRHLYRILIGVFAFVLLFSFFQLVRIFLGYQESRNEYDSLIEKTPAPRPDSTIPSEMTTEEEPYVVVQEDGTLSINYEALTGLNQDYVGWLRIPETNINYPMVYHSDNDYYLRRTFLGSHNVGGAIFLDSRTGKSFESDHVIIYGHRMNDGSMFSDVKKYLDPSYYESHKQIFIYTKSEILTYEVFSARTVSVEDSCYTFSFSNHDTYVSWLKTMKAAAPYPTSLNPDGSSGTITLSTCVYNDGSSRNIVQACLVGREPIES